MFGIQFYPTPKPVVEMMMDKVEWSGVRFVLEPSAGKGDIVDGVAKQLKGKVHQIECVEIDPDLREVLRGLGFPHYVIWEHPDLDAFDAREL